MFPREKERYEVRSKANFFNYSLSTIIRMEIYCRGVLNVCKFNFWSSNVYGRRPNIHAMTSTKVVKNDVFIKAFKFLCKILLQNLYDLILDNS